MTVLCPLLVWVCCSHLGIGRLLRWLHAVVGVCEECPCADGCCLMLLVWGCCAAVSSLLVVCYCCSLVCWDYCMWLWVVGSCVVPWDGSCICLFVLGMVVLVIGIVCSSVLLGCSDVRSCLLCCICSLLCFLLFHSMVAGISGSGCGMSVLVWCCLSPYWCFLSVVV